MAFNFNTLAPYLGATGDALINVDENTTGADDFAGQLLLYAAEVIAAVNEDESLPELPQVLKNGVTDKISGIARVSLIVASSILTVAQFQTTGDAAKALKYVNQAIRLLLSGAPVPQA